MKEIKYRQVQRVDSFVGMTGLMLIIMVSMCSHTMYAQGRDTAVRRVPILRTLPTDTSLPLYDSTKNIRVIRDTSIGTTAPGEYPYAPEQDSAYYAAIGLDVPPSSRFMAHVRLTQPQWLALKEMKQLSPMEAIIANMNAIPSSSYKPRGRDLALYQYNLQQALSIPGIYNFDPAMQQYRGVQIPLSLIGSLLGLTEDVSPLIKYSVETDSYVEIVIYSTQAVAIRRLFAGNQMRGDYSMMWDGNTDSGYKPGKGDYVAEVRIGERGIVRKRIRFD